MDCCKTQVEDGPRRRWWRGASGCAGSGLLLALAPKCPMCLAAYLAVWTGAGVATQAAALLRPLLGVVFAASMLVVAVTLLARVRVR
jgi:hypothetical protein